MSALIDPARHEPLAGAPWDESLARATVERVVRLAETAFTPQAYWPAHPRDSDKQGPHYMLYAGGCGAIWSLQYLQARGAVALSNDYADHVLPMLAPNRSDFGERSKEPFGSYLMGDTSIWMLREAFVAGDGRDAIASLIEATIDHPAREFMWGAAGTLTAAQLMHRRSGEARFADLFRATARKLWSQLEWSDAHRLHYLTQHLPNDDADFIDAVHGFIGIAPALIQGRDLLPSAEWVAWRECLTTMTRSCAEREGPLANWRARLSTPAGRPMRMQFCHGAPGFLACLGDFPDDSLDDLLEAGGEAIWRAGPLAKGPQLCHGTSGNGYAFLKLFRRTGEPKWLDRARAFAMHAVLQFERELAEHRRPWFSLWTGHMGLAVYLWDCVEGTDRFPTLDVFYA
jgi:hypothetical protein